MNTTIQYMHRTGDNYKSFKTVVVRGTLTLDQVKPLCYGPTPGCFKPEDLNLEYPDAAVETEDNPWCEFLNFLPTVHSDDLFPFYHPDDQAANLLHLLEETKRDHDRVEDDGGPTAEDLGHAPGDVAEPIRVLPEMVECDCGHECGAAMVMSASMGTACPDCYDMMSD